VILTILPEETSAVLNSLSAHGSFQRERGTNLHDWRGIELDSYQGRLRVIVGTSDGAGNDRMQAAATDGLHRFQPVVLLVVGVAGGIPKGTDPMCAGDIVIGNAVWSIDRGAIGDKGLQARPQGQLAGWGLLKGMENIAHDARGWAKGLTNKDGTAPRLITGGIAATNYVLKVQEHELFQAIVTVTGNAARAVEMESWGAAFSGQQYIASSLRGVSFGMVRGLSDIVLSKVGKAAEAAKIAADDPVSAGEANSKERDEWKQKAANNAAALVAAWIQHAWPYSPSLPVPSARPGGEGHVLGSPALVTFVSGVALSQPLSEPERVALQHAPAQTLSPRDAAMKRLREDIRQSLKEAAARPFLLSLRDDQELGLDPTIADPGADPFDLIDALDRLPSKTKMFALQRAIRSQSLPVGSDGLPHPIERAATGLYLRAAVLAVNVEAAKVFGQSNHAVTIVPEKNQALIAILMAALHGEFRSITLQEEAHSSGQGKSQHIKGKGLIDLDGLPFFPLMTDDALESEVHALLGSPGGDFSISSDASQQGEPSMRAKRRQLIADTVEQRREVTGERYRFIVSNGDSWFAQDDAKCQEVYRDLGVPFARIVPGQVTDTDVIAVLGVSAGTMETRLREFLGYLNQARLPVAALPVSPANDATEMLKVLLALMKENADVKAQLSGPIEKLEVKSGVPVPATLNETLETAKKGMETVNAYTGLWGQIYTATKALLDLLP
jgi:nucleoside phosphorylase